MVGSTQKLMEQASEYLEDYLVSMRQISDTVYYNVIKENDFSSQAQSIQSGMNLLYEVNGDNLQSIAIYNDYGRLMAAEPVAAEKEIRMSQNRIGIRRRWRFRKICTFQCRISRICSTMARFGIIG